MAALRLRGGRSLGRRRAARGFSATYERLRTAQVPEGWHVRGENEERPPLGRHLSLPGSAEPQLPTSQNSPSPRLAPNRRRARVLRERERNDLPAFLASWIISALRGSIRVTSLWLPLPLSSWLWCRRLFLRLRAHSAPRPSYRSIAVAEFAHMLAIQLGGRHAIGGLSTLSHRSALRAVQRHLMARVSCIRFSSPI